MCSSSPKVEAAEPVQPTVIYMPAQQQSTYKAPEVPEPEPPPKASKPTTEAAVRARQEQATTVAAKKGYKGSVNTGGLGLDDAADTTKKRLLSGTE